MTALCGGGSSGPQTGVQTVITLSAVAIEAFVSTVLGMPEIAPIVAPIIATTVSFDIAAYCATDPPADPGLTAADLASALAFPATAQTLAAQEKIVTWFKSRYWYQICQCTSTTTPAAPAPSNPGNTSSNPGLPANPTPCWRVTVPWSVTQASSSQGTYWTDETPYALPPGLITNVVIGTGPLVTTNGLAVKLPSGTTNLQLSGTIDQAVGGTTGFHTDVIYQGYTSAGGFSPGDAIDLSWTQFNGTAAQSGVVATVPGTSDHALVYIQNTDRTVAHTGTLTLSFFCAPGVSVAQACCPPDPLLQGLLEQILALETAIFEGLPIPLNSFAEGTVHTGLAGLGTVAISPLAVGIKVVLTTVPPYLGQAVSDPTRYFDAGFVGFATSEGTYATQRIQHSPQVFSVPPLGYTVEYTLLNGVIASITELTRGP